MDDLFELSKEKKKEDEEEDEEEVELHVKEMSMKTMVKFFEICHEPQLGGKPTFQ